MRHNSRLSFGHPLWHCRKPHVMMFQTDAKGGGGHDPTGSQEKTGMSWMKENTLSTLLL